MKVVEYDTDLFNAYGVPMAMDLESISEACVEPTFAFILQLADSVVG